MPYIDVQGAKAHYLHRAPVPAGSLPLIFLHGAGGSHRHWLYQLRDLPGAQAYALDLPGHEQSEGPPRDSIEAYADWLVAFMDAARLGRTILVGHSMGGAIALQVALRHPERVGGLVLISTGARLKVAPGLLDAIRQDFSAAVGLMGDWAYGPQAPRVMVRLGQRQLSEAGPDLLCADFGACDSFQVMDCLGEIAAPTLVVCGSLDRMTPPKYSTYLRDNIRGARLQVIEGAGHMLMIEDPGAVSEALASFLAQLA